MKLSENTWNAFCGAGDPREPFRSTTDLEAKLFVVETERAKNRRVQIFERMRIFNSEDAEFIRGADPNSRLHAAASHPNGEAGRVVLASVVALHHRRAAK